MAKFKVLDAEAIALLSPEALVEYNAALAASEVVIKKAKLTLPRKYTIIGTVVSIAEREADSEAGGKFKRNTKIITLSDVKTQQCVDVFISENQWADYGCEQHLFLGNVVSMTLEANIANTTGYMEDANATVLTPHLKTFNSFNKVVYADDIQLMVMLSTQGVSDGIVGLICNSVANKRAVHERILANKSLANSEPAFAGQVL